MQLKTFNMYLKLAANALQVSGLPQKHPLTKRTWLSNRKHHSYNIKTVHILMTQRSKVKAKTQIWHVTCSNSPYKRALLAS